MRHWVAKTKRHRGRLNESHKEVVKTALVNTDRVAGDPGLRRSPTARREAGLPDRRVRVLSLGGEDAGERVRDRIGDTATLPRAPLRDRARPGYGGGLRKLRTAIASRCTPPSVLRHNGETPLLRAAMSHAMEVVNEFIERRALRAHVSRQPALDDLRGATLQLPPGRRGIPRIDSFALVDDALR